MFYVQFNVIVYSGLKSHRLFLNQKKQYHLFEPISSVLVHCSLVSFNRIN